MKYMYCRVTILVKKIKLTNIVDRFALFSLQKRYLTTTVSIMKNFYKRFLKHQTRDKSKTLFTQYSICKKMENNI